jgi:peptidoglycan hydrolase FlgJ
VDIGPLRQGIPLNGASAPSDPVSVADAARKLEQQFARMLIASMRTTSLGDEMFPGASEHYRDMYDQQLAGALTRGKGLGLQEMIRRQLGGGTADRAGVSIEQATKMYSMDGYRRLPGAMQPLPAAAKSRPLPAPLPISPPEWIGRAGQRASAKVAAEAAPTGSRASDPASVGAASAATTAIPAASDCDGTPATNPKPNSPEAFIARIWPHAQRAAAELGVCPKVLVAQAALETGWGRHTIRRNGGDDAHNLFGIKAGGRWSGDAVTRSTSEYVNGAKVQENAAFRAYRSVADSFADYVNLIKNSPRYAAALGASTTRAFASALQRAGYATDPQYAAKLTAIAEGPTLNRALARIDGPTLQGA